ncbi:MAG: RnfABCDGE type electron transport complex subunit B, partial [Thermodesulfobacteriota bacterium]|nr:RnfABCDGE type electron transport complex subunit B [Thermodesulfobacteriota bacterium]
MIIAALVIGGLGMAAAVALGVAANIFRVEIDPLVLEIEEALPGANCGGCGYPGCSAAAEAIAKGIMPANGCVGGGPDVQIAVAAILGVEIKETEPEVARVGCRYPVSRADIKFNYHGVTDCRAAVQLAGGPKECPVGCIGLGSCVKACPFDALSMGPDGLPVVDEKKCTGCGTCVRTCPVGIMQLTSVSNRILNEYTWDECTAPCQRRCPAGIDIPEQIRRTALGNYEQALIVIKERNPLPLICGRICPRPCESDCRRNLVDEPVAINYLKRFVADYERLSGQRYQPFKAPATGRKIALIGGGAQGLSAAYFLARLGHSPAIYESRPELGGLLRTAIPESRLPRDVLDWEIEGILEMGVEAETSKSFGRDINLSRLFDQGFENVFLATGGWDALLTPGHEIMPAPALPGIYLLMPLTMAWAAGRDVDLGSHTALVGDGREMLDTARLCLSKGAARVTVFSFVSKKQMGVTDEEVSQSEAEGITLLNETAVTRLMGVGDCLTEL